MSAKADRAVMVIWQARRSKHERGLRTGRQYNRFTPDIYFFRIHFYCPAMPDAVATTVTDHGAPPKVPVNKETLREAARLFGYLLPYKGKFFAAMVALLISSGLGLVFPFLIGSLFNIAIGPGRVGLPMMGTSGPLAGLS